MGQSQTGKSKSNLTAIVVIVAVLVLLSIGGYLISRSLADKAVNKVTNSSNDLISSPAQWPSDIVMNVPEYKKGSVKSVVKLEKPKTWDIIIEKTSKSDYEKYIEEVKAAGWTMEAEGAMIADYTSFKKDNWDLTVVYDSSSNGVKITLVEPVQ